MISKAFSRAFHILKYFRTYKKLDIWARGFKIYIRPILEYCVEIWAPIQKTVVDKVEKVQKFFTRSFEKIIGYLN